MPLAEHDLQFILPKLQLTVSIHVPLAEHDDYRLMNGKNLTRFNSRAPRGARLTVPLLCTLGILVSIHVPLAEHD